jgi:hypothetical protein
MSSQRRRRQPRREREGAALLIVLFILMMATATAVFAMQSTQFEQRAAGALHQATRAKYVAEGATMNVLALCYQGGTEGCVDIMNAVDDLTATNRERYGLPNHGLSESVYSVSAADFPITPTTNFRVDAVDTDVELGAAVPTAMEPGFLTVLEKWPVPNSLGDGRERYRLIVTTYGEIAAGNFDVLRTGSELRFGHETISATRAYFDVR